MENYKILQRLGKGAQGAVYITERRQDGHKFVLKKVECNDESEANKAFKEALLLQQLEHPYICGYKEFFVTWDKEISAMFVCIVMDFYSNGDLYSTLKEYREKREKVDEDVIKKWLGQIIEAVMFTHSKGVIHRDLKPSNVFIQDDTSLAVGDFGVSTVMADVLTRTRTTVGTMNWMAPEVLDRPADERSDVWSVGCILLEMATCHCLDTSEIHGKLSEIKHTPGALDDTLAEVTKEYSSDLVAVIKQMLQHDHQQRPNTKQLAALPYVSECLQFSEVIMLEKRRRMRSARKSPRALPKDKGVLPVIDFIIDNLGDESAVRNAMETLAAITKEDGNVAMDTDGKRVIVKAMKDYISEEDIQVLGCQVLSHLIVTATADDFLFSTSIVSAVTSAMKAHRKSASVQRHTAAVLMGLSADEQAAESIGSQGGIEELQVALTTFADDPDVCTAALNALWSLCVNEENVHIATERKAVRSVVAALQSHTTRTDLIEAATAVLLSLAMEDENLELINDLNCVGIVLEVMAGQVKEARVVRNSCLALAAMVEPDEESAYKVLTNVHKGEEVAGIPILLKAYEAHKDNAEVVESLCTLIMELVEYDLIGSELEQGKVPRMLRDVRVKFMTYKDIHAEMTYHRIVDKVLLEIYQIFKDRVEIMGPCESALLKISGGKLPLQVSAAVAAKTRT